VRDILKAIIPAAGYATRLYPLTKDRPKSLLPIAGKPIIEYILDKIREIKAVDKIFIVTNAKFYRNFVKWKKSLNFELPIEIVNDETTSNETRLGAIGDKFFVIKKENIADDLLDISGDNLFNFFPKDMYPTFQKRRKTLIALYDVKDWEIAKRMGIADVGTDGRIVNFIEKPEVPPSTLTSIGIYMYPREVVKLFQVYIEEGNSPDAPGYFIQWLYKREEVYGHTFEVKWYDIGDMGCYQEADEYFKTIAA